MFTGHLVYINIEVACHYVHRAHNRTKDSLTIYLLVMSTPQIFFYNKIIFYLFQKLSPGMHKLLRTKTLPYKVNMTAQSSIEVDGEIIEENQNGSSLSVEGSPIVGNNTGVLLFKSIYGSNKKEILIVKDLTTSTM